MAGLSTVSLAMMWRYLPETMGLSLEDIAALFEDDNFPANIHIAGPPNERTKLVVAKEAAGAAASKAGSWLLPASVLGSSCLPPDKSPAGPLDRTSSDV